MSPDLNGCSGPGGLGDPPLFADLGFRYAKLQKYGSETLILLEFVRSLRTKVFIMKGIYGKCFYL